MAGRADPYAPHPSSTDCVDSFLIPIYQRSGLHSKLLATPPPTDEVTTAAWGAIDAQLVGLGAKASGGLDALLWVALLSEGFFDRSSCSRAFFTGARSCLWRWRFRSGD